MSRSPMYDPQTSEARSPWLAGLTEICNKLSGVLDMETDTFEDLTLPELYISEEDRYRIYQAPLGNKLWLQTPPPIIRKNGIQIDPSFDGFEIDHLGGSIAFNDEYLPGPEDIITASATYIVDKSNTIEAIRTQINDLARKSSTFKGSFETLESLITAYDIGMPGDYAIVQEYDAVYVWSDTYKAWVDTYKETDLSNYLNKEQIDSLLELKEDNIAAKGTESSDDSYYFGGRKTWVSLAEQVLNIAISGLMTSDDTELRETDTIIEALGKLQAQISSNIHPLSGSGEPTIYTTGEIGQDYVNTSNGDKYHLVGIDNTGTNPEYIWEQYADVSSVIKYVDSSIQSAVLSAWKRDY